jgi:hypothetical protein
VANFWAEWTTAARTVSDLVLVGAKYAGLGSAQIPEMVPERLGSRVRHLGALIISDSVACQRRRFGGIRRCHRDRAALREPLPGFLLAAFDRDCDGAAIGAVGGSTATASISMSAPSRASPEMAMVVLAGLLWSCK